MKITCLDMKIVLDFVQGDIFPGIVYGGRVYVQSGSFEAQFCSGNTQYAGAGTQIKKPGASGYYFFAE